MSSQERFDLSNPEYQHVADLPEFRQKYFVDYDNGFVREEAFQPMLEAKIMEIIHNDPDALAKRIEVLCDEATEHNEYRDANPIKFATYEFQSNREFVLNAIRNGDKYGFRHISEELKSDREVAIEAIKQSPWNFQYASASLCADREIALLAVGANGNVLRAASTELQNDREVVAVALQSTGISVFTYASDELRADRDFVMWALQNAVKDSHGWEGELQRVGISAHLYTDKELMMVAAKRTPSNLQSAPAVLRGDREFMSEVINTTSRGLNLASNELKADRNFLCEIAKNASVLLYSSNELRGDRTFVLEVVRMGHETMQTLPTNYYADQEIVLEILKYDKSPGAFHEGLSIKLRDDDNVVFDAIMTSPDALKHASDRLKYDLNFLLRVAKAKPEALLHAPALIREKLGL